MADCKNCKAHKGGSEMDALKESTVISRIVADNSEKADKDKKRLMIICLVQAGVIALLVLSLVFIATNGQKAIDDAVLKAINSVGKITVDTETNTTTDNQDTGEGGGNNVFQAGEYAAYSESEAK